MRTIKLIFIIPCLLFVFSACQKDNFSAPNATISGAFTDAEIGGPLNLSENGGGGSVNLLVNDPALYPIPSNLGYVLKQDGTYFNSFVFADKYRMFPQVGSGPWIYTGQVAPTAALPGGVPDSINVVVAKGQNTVTNFKVYPYFRLTIAVVDTNVTVNISQSVQSVLNVNNITGGGDLVVYVNNYPTVFSGTSPNAPGSAYYVDKWNFTINNTTTGVTWSAASSSQSYTFGTDLKLPINDILKTDGSVQVFGIRWALTHLPKGTYYWRASIVGTKSNGQPNYSNTVAAVVH